MQTDKVSALVLTTKPSEALTEVSRPSEETDCTTESRLGDFDFFVDDCCSPENKAIKRLSDHDDQPDISMAEFDQSTTTYPQQIEWTEGQDLPSNYRPAGLESIDGSQLSHDEQPNTEPSDAHFDIEACPASESLSIEPICIEIDHHSEVEHSEVCESERLH